MTKHYITQTKFTSLVGTELTYPDGRKVTSEYDSLYRRTTAYLYQDWQTIEERNGSNTTTKQYLWGEYIDELLQMKTAVEEVKDGGRDARPTSNLPAGDYYPLQDLLYRNTALTDSSGAIVETYDTDAYSNTLIFKSAGANNNWWADDAVQTDNPACDVIYAGYRYDPESKLYYVRHRTYNPVLGRWLQRDPIGYQVSINLYQYVKGCPEKIIDYRGLGFISGAISIAAGVGKTIGSSIRAAGNVIINAEVTVINDTVGVESGIANGISSIAGNGGVCGCARWAPAWQVGGYKSLTDCEEASSSPYNIIGEIGELAGNVSLVFGFPEVSIPVSFISGLFGVGADIGGMIGCSHQVCVAQKQYHWDGCEWICS